MNKTDLRKIYFSVFFSGMSVMGVEMASSRLLAPYFGSSLLVWTNIIGVIMFSLSLGYYFGGRLSDREPTMEKFFNIILVSGIFVALVPIIANPVLNKAANAINSMNVPVVVITLIITLLIFVIPFFILGVISPYAIRIANDSIENSGKVAGKIFAFSTIGSIFGTYLPAIVMIQFLGTKNTILAFATVLILISTIFRFTIKKSVVLLIFLSLFFLPNSRLLRNSKHLKYFTESIYHYIQVLEYKSKVTNNVARYLVLNEGHAVHTVYFSHTVLTGGYYDYFSLLPKLNPPKKDQKKYNVLILGLCAGTFARQYNHFYNKTIDMDIDGVEIDSKIVDLGKKYFEMNFDNLTTHCEDGRTFIKYAKKKYDLILIDVFRQPYIPFHMTTKQFFSEVREHLNEDGIVAMNVGSTSKDTMLYKMMSSTLANTYKKTYVFEVPTRSKKNVTFTNYMFMASNSKVDFNRLAKFDNIDLYDLSQNMLTAFRKNNIENTFNDKKFVLTDDKAPVEFFTERMILDYILKL